MSEMSSVIAELRRLKDIKDENIACLARREIINNEIESESQDVLTECATRLNDLKESQSEKLDKFIPQDVCNYKKNIPVCEVDNVKPLYPIAGLAFYAALILLIASMFVGLEIGGLLMVLYLVGFFVGGGIWLCKNYTIGDYFDWKKERKEWLTNASANEVDKQELLNAFKIFDDAFFSEMETFAQEEDKELEEYMSRKDEIAKPYAQELDFLDDKIQKCFDELTSSDILHQDYILYLDNILRNLETGRADSLKESINIALEDERKDNEESARRQEARRQEEILQEQAYQNQLHNMEMQRKADDQAREARQHAAIMEKQAALQIKETQKLREEIKRQNQNNKR